MPSSKAAIVGMSGSLDHWDTGAHGLIHTGTDASRRKESRGQRPTLCGQDVLFICQASTLTICKFQCDPGISVTKSGFIEDVTKETKKKIRE